MVITRAAQSGLFLVDLCALVWIARTALGWLLDQNANDKDEGQ